MVPVLASRAKKAEELRMVPAETVQEMQETGFFRVLQPKRNGGYEMEPPVFYAACMTLAYRSMSTAWIYGVIGVLNWQISAFDTQGAETVFGQRRTTPPPPTQIPTATPQPEHNRS